MIKLCFYETMQVTGRFFLYVFSAFLLLSDFLYADIVVFQSGRTLENVKIKVGRDTAEILFENGKKEVRSKSELKSIKLRPITWILKSTQEESKIITRKNIAEEMAKLEQERELNYAVPAKILEERKRHDFLMKERIRLQYTEGLLSYAGGQIFYTEIMVKNKDRFYVRNEYGLQHFSIKDFGEEFIIETDKGKEKIDLSKMLAVKEEKYIDGYIYLASGERFRGKIEKNLGDQVLISTNRGEIRITASEILFPPLPQKVSLIITIKEGENGLFLLNNGQSISGKLIKMSKDILLIETAYGMLEMDLAKLVSATKEETAK